MATRQLRTPAGGAFIRIRQGPGDRSGPHRQNGQVMDEQQAMATLRREHPGEAEDAAAALGWLKGGNGLHTISQLRVQEFLWHALPVKWLTSSREQLRVAAALGNLFTLAGMDRYAAICHSPRTEQIITAYHEQGHDAGLAAYAAAVESGGLAPPDTGLLAWGTVTGPDEYAAYEACAAALELADAAGQLRPDQRGATSRRATLVERWLVQLRPELGGDSWLGRVHAERASTWSHGHHGEFSRLALQVSPRLLEPITPPDDALPTLKWLLDHAEGGITLTARHYIAPKLVTEAVDRFGWRKHLIGTLRQEREVFPLYDLRHLAQRELRALRRTGTKLVLTAAGKRIRQDEQLRWEAGTSLLVGHEPPNRPDFTVAAREATLLVLLVEGATDRRGQLAKRVARILGQHRWQTRDDHDLSDAVQHAIYELRHRLWALDLLRDPRSLGPELTLTGTGEAAALTALRQRALRPATASGSANG